MDFRAPISSRLPFTYARVIKPLRGCVPPRRDYHAYPRRKESRYSRLLQRGREYAITSSARPQVRYLSARKLQGRHERERAREKEKERGGRGCALHTVSIITGAVMSMRCRRWRAANTAPPPLNTIRNEFVAREVRESIPLLPMIQLIRERMPGTPSLM